MDKATYQKIYHKLDHRPRPDITLFILLLDIGLFSFALYLLNQGSTFGYIVAQILIAIVGLHNFALFHECVHDMAVRGTFLNSVIGHWCSLFCYLPYFPWKSIHREHHNWTGILDKDPVLKLIQDFDPNNKPRIWLVKKCWKLWLPIAEFFQTLVYWFYPLVLISQKKMKTKLLKESIFSSLLLIGVYAYLFFVHHDLFNFWNFAPAVALYMIIQEMISLPHHMGLPMAKYEDIGRKFFFWEQHHFARSCHFLFPISELLMLNFNFHTEHHFFPKLPWFRLRQAEKLIHPELKQDYNEIDKFDWSFDNRKKEVTEVFYRPFEEQTNFCRD